jgi:hypothetical protein
MIDVEMVESFYQYFYTHVYRDNKFVKYTTSIRDCETFIKLVDKEYTLQSVGVNFLWEYFVYQFDYWYELKFKNGFSDKVVLAWIIGKKAFDRWKTRDREYDWIIDKSVILDKYKLQKNELFSKNVQPEKSGYDASKAIRKQHLNTEKGFAICVQYTTLFDPKDVSCIMCKHKKECKELLRVNYPKLYRQRNLL